MSKLVKPTKGYYSILQFVPDPDRGEGANIGVVVFCPEIGFLRAATIDSNDRVRRFFGPDLYEELDLDRVNTLKAAFEEGVASAEGSLHTSDDFQNFITARANQLILTPARPIKVADPESDLAELLDRLVGGRRSTRQKSEAPTTERLTRDLAKLVEKRKLESKLERNKRIHSELLGRDLVFPFAYHNGTANLVQVVAFNAASPESNVDRACPLVVEAAEVSKSRLKGHLHVVAAFRSDQPQTPRQVERLLEAYKVCLHPWDRIDEFLDGVEKPSH